MGVRRTGAGRHLGSVREVLGQDAGVLQPAVAPLAAPFEDVRRIAVLRGGGLGDLIFALPAVAALRAAYPEAEVVLLGTRGHAALLAGRGLVDEVVPLPATWPGVHGDVKDEAASAAFAAEVRGAGLDLAVQAHGGGRNSNPFLALLAARHTVGTATPDAPPLERVIPYEYYQHEVLRWLEVAGLAGAAPVTLEPVLPVLDAERVAAAELLGPGPHVVLHPGATDERRRWPAERFGEVAAALVADGVRVAVVGDPSEAAVVAQVVAAARDRLDERQGSAVVDLAGRLDLPGLVGVLATADVVLANDSGPRHLAQAVGTRTVGIFIFGNVINAMPFGRGRHRIAISHITRCPVCGVDVTQVGWNAQRCEHDPSFVADVTVEEVLGDVRALLAG
jgi:ADP-heptose:LPS heptosyltransferase